MCSIFDSNCLTGSGEPPPLFFFSYLSGMSIKGQSYSISVASFGTECQICNVLLIPEDAAVKTGVFSFAHFQTGEVTGFLVSKLSTVQKKLNLIFRIQKHDLKYSLVCLNCQYFIWGSFFCYLTLFSLSPSIHFVFQTLSSTASLKRDLRCEFCNSKMCVSYIQSVN